MPIGSQSRYRGIAVHEVELPDGTRRATIGLRRSPPPDGETYDHVVAGVEDLEYLAWRQLGNSDAWWRIAEANPLVFPLDIRPGTTVAIPLGGDAGRIERSRKF